MQHRSPAVELTMELVARPSVTPDDAGCQDILVARLEHIGFTAERMRFGQVDNFWAIRRGGEGPVTCFIGHTDVVPAGPRERWTSDPFVPEVRDGWLYGRGVADMKSGLAAAVAACEAYVAAHPTYPGAIAFVVTSDEEGPARDGTRRVAEALAARGERIDRVVVAEPSSQREFGDTVRIGRRGSLTGRLTLRGIQGHVAYPERARNPIHALLPALTELAARRWDEGNAHFPPTSFQASNIRAGTGAANVIPGELALTFNLRWCPVQTEEGLKREIAALLDRHGLEYTIDWSEASLPYYTPPGALSSLVTAAVEEVAGKPPVLSTNGGTSDGRFFAAQGAEVVEFGIDNRTIHQVDERCRVEDIERLQRVYESILRRSFAG